MEYLALALFAVGLLFLCIGFFSVEPKSQKFKDSLQLTEELAGKVKENLQKEFSPIQAISRVDNHPSPPQSSIKETITITDNPKNPELFSSKAYLYLDYNSQNVYDGLQPKYKLNHTRDIRRFGEGSFSYNGNGFHFSHANGTEEFKLNQLNHLAFYPNCLAMVPKNNLPVVLVFLSETDNLRRVMETFKLNHE